MLQVADGDQENEATDSSSKGQERGAGPSRAGRLLHRIEKLRELKETNKSSVDIPTEGGEGAPTRGRGKQKKKAEAVVEGGADGAGVATKKRQRKPSPNEQGDPQSIIGECSFSNLTPPPILSRHRRRFAFRV